MELEQKELWELMMAEWDNKHASCHLHLSKLYTKKYPNDMFGWISLADALYGSNPGYMEARSLGVKSLNASLAIWKEL